MMTDATSLAARLAQFAISTPAESLQGPARDIVYLSMADFIAVARAGAEEPVARITRQMVMAEEGRAEAALVGSNARAPARAAALANGAAGHALDLSLIHI
mgnify:CR=1 FL=1